MNPRSIKNKIEVTSIIKLAKLKQVQSIVKKIQCNLDLVTLLVSAKTVTKLHNVTKSNDFM